MLFRFCLYGFLKNQRYFEPFMMLALMSKELSFFWIGVLYACRWATLNVLEIVSGAIADQWGRRRSMIASFSAYVISFLVFALGDGFAPLMMAMVLFGVGDAFRTGTHKAMIFHWLKLQGRQDERTKIYGLTRSWSKYGSAVSAILAAVFLLLTRDYQSVFLFAAIPCVLNIVNFLGYPKNLETEFEATSESVWSPFRSLVATALQVRSSGALRILLLESMSWEGVFHAVKDYLQPALLAFVVAATLGNEIAGQPNGLSADAVSFNAAGVIVISCVYALLNVLSALASRRAHVLVEKLRGAESAATCLWWCTLAIYLLIGLTSLMDWQVPALATFVGLAVMQNVWRPILIGRIDAASDSRSGATLLSVESQTQRLTTMLIAPVLGYIIDLLAKTQHQEVFSLSLWPIGVLGCLAAMFAIIARGVQSSKPLATDPTDDASR